MEEESLQKLNGIGFETAVDWDERFEELKAFKKKSMVTSVSLYSTTQRQEHKHN
jgi:hypothetical protein